MEDKLIMNQKERQRKGVFDQVARSDLTQMEAAYRLQLSYRQTKRMYQRYLQEKDTCKKVMLV